MITVCGFIINVTNFVFLDSPFTPSFQNIIYLSIKSTGIVCFLIYQIHRFPPCVQWGSISAPIKKSERITINGAINAKGKPKRTWQEALVLGLTEKMALK